MVELTIPPRAPTDRCLRVAIAEWPPYVSGVYPDYTGSCVDIFKVIQKKLGFCYQFVQPPDGLWGAPLPNGSWFGMMGMLARKEVDMAVGPFGVTLSRSTVAKFSVPILSTDHAVLYRRPLLSPDLLGFTKPFKLPVWSGVLGGLLVVTAVTILCQLLTPSSAQEDTRDEDDAAPHLPRPTWHSSWFWGYVILIGQVPEVLWQAGVGEAERLVLTTWMLVSLIVGVVYKSNLQAMLIVPRVKIPFDTLEELVAQKEIPWTFPKGSIVHDFLEAAYTEETHSTMGRGWARHSDLLLHPKFIIPATLHGVAGLYTRHSSLYLMATDFSEHGACRMSITRGGFMFVQYSFGFPLNSSLRPAVDFLIYRLKEFGLLEKLLQSGTGNTSYCLQPPGRENLSDLRTLAIGDFLGVFTLYAAGMVGCVVAFLLEVACGR